MKILSVIHRLSDNGEIVLDFDPISENFLGKFVKHQSDTHLEQCQKYLYDMGDAQPKQTKILKNAFKRTIGNRDCDLFTVTKKAFENSFIGVVCKLLGVKKVNFPVFER